MRGAGRSAFLAFGIVAGLVSPVLAASPIGNVGTAKVDALALSTELRLGYTLDGQSDRADGRLRVRQHVDYGFNDWYAVRLVAEQNRFDGGNYDYVGFTFENRLQFFEKAEHGFDGGMRIIYGQRDNDDTPNEIDVRFMGMGSIADAWKWRHNIVLEHDVGPDSRDGVMLELRSQVTRAVKTDHATIKSLDLGLEVFNDFGRLKDLSGFASQDHQAGPVVKAGFAHGVYVQAGYRAGLSEDAPDHLAKIFLGRKF